MTSPCYCTLLRATTRRMASLYDEALLAFGINIAQFSLLRTIRRKQPVSLTELANVTSLDRSTMGRNVRVLERLGLAATARSEGDQREQVVNLTDEGERRLTQAAPVWLDCQTRIENRLGPEKINAMREILAAL